MKREMTTYRRADGELIPARLIDLDGYELMTTDVSHHGDLILPTVPRSRRFRFDEYDPTTGEAIFIEVPNE